jgi:hypothetical protein
MAQWMLFLVFHFGRSNGGERCRAWSFMVKAASSHRSRWVLFIKEYSVATTSHVCIYVNCFRAKSIYTFRLGFLSNTRQL